MPDTNPASMPYINDEDDTRSVFETMRLATEEERSQMRQSHRTRKRDNKPATTYTVGLSYSSGPVIKEG